MDMQADIKWIQTELERLQDPSLIHMLKRLIQYEKEQKFEPDKQFLDEYNESINRSVKQIEEGKYHTQSQMREKLAQWLKRK